MKRLLPALYLLCTGAMLCAQPQLSNPSGCGLGLQIPDATCPDDAPFAPSNPFEISVNNAPGTTLGTDVYLKEVRLLIEHGWTGDLDIKLQSPAGIEVELSSDNGGGNNNYGDPDLDSCAGYMTFAAAACASIADQAEAVPPFTAQAFLPEGSLFAFNDSITNPNGTWILSICDDLEADSGTLEFVELVFEPISCLPVESVQVLNVDSTTVVLDWGPSGGCQKSSTYIEYGPPGFTPGTGENPGMGGAIAVANCPPFALRGLAPDQDYDIYLRKRCSDERFSANSCGDAIRTTCLPPAPTSRATFDQEVSCTRSCDQPCSIDTLWQNEQSAGMNWILNAGPTPTQGTGPASDVNGDGKYLYLETSGSTCDAGSEAILLSDCYEFQRGGSDTCHFSFNYHMNGPDVGTLRVQVTNDDGQHWQTLWSRSGSAGDAWRKVYLSLAAFAEGQRLRIRLIGSKGGGSRGDIAIDDLAWHGSRYLGPAQQRYYADQDADGFGDPSQAILSCASSPPAGFVADSTDCNDQDARINPAAPEGPCDGVDNNCNGSADDVLLPPPLTQNDTICSEEQAVITATSQFGKFIFWYDQAEGGNPITFGEIFAPELPPNEGPLPQIYRFYAAETDLTCSSQPRAEVVVVVQPRPSGQLATQPEFCPGTEVDLRALPLTDQNFSAASLTFHTAATVTASNRVDSTRFRLQGDTLFYYRYRTEAGCQDDGPVFIAQKPGPALSFSISDSTALCLETEQTLAVQAVGGKQPYAIQWSNGVDSSVVQIAAGPLPGIARSLSVQVTDAAGCFTRDTITYLTTSSIDSLQRSVTDVSTCGGSDGVIRLQPLDGLPPFRYQWQGSDGSSGDTSGVQNFSYEIVGLAQGQYNVTITDNSSEQCAFRLRNAVVNGPEATLRDVNIINVSCRGGNDGRIELDLIGSPTISWSDGRSGPILDSLQAGTYSVSITEGNCQTVLSDLQVGEPDSLRIRPTLVPPACANSNDGQIRTEVFGGSPSYSYTWSTGAQTPELVGVSAGSYQLSIMDANGCQRTDTLVLSGPAPLQVSADSMAPITCLGDEDAYLQVAISGGTRPYSFGWADGTTQLVRAGLGPGQYQFNVTDGEGCSATRRFDVSALDSLDLSLTAKTDPICVGDNSGTLGVIGNGGSSPYRFDWNTGDTTANVQNLGVGTYSVTLSDSRGCPGPSLQTTLNATSQIDFDLLAAAPRCEGVSDGSLELRPGNSNTLHYQWSTGDTTAAISGLSAGQYRVTITDEQHCVVDTSFLVQPATAPFDIRFGIVPPACANSRDGVIDLQLQQAGQPPLQYQWSDGSTEQDREGITAGNYQVTVTDANGCAFRSDTLRLPAPPALRIDLLSLGGIQCQGDSSGFIELLVEGGTGALDYNWSGTDAAGPAAFDLPAGNYTLFVEDENGCTRNATYNLAAPEALLVDVDLQIGNVCLGDSSNVLRAQVQGGSAPYQYRWSSGDTTQRVENLRPGSYSLTVTDENNCRQGAGTIKLRDPGQALRLDTFSSRDVSCFGESDGRLQVRIEGGNAPFQYLFSNGALLETSARSVALPSLPPDEDYAVTVLDALGCVVTSTALSVEEPDLLNLRRDSVIQLSCGGSGRGSIFVTAGGGTRPFAYEWFDAKGERVANTEDLREFPAGVYQCVVTDANLCSDTLNPVTLFSEQTAIVLDTVILEQVRCRGASSGRISVQISGGNPPYRYLWNDGSTSNTLQGLSAGSYALTVTDSDSCRQVFEDLLITEPDSALSATADLDQITCADANDGRIAVAVQGGTPTYTYLWRRSGLPIAFDTAAIGGLGEGRYQLLLTDEAGCQRSYSYLLNAPDSIRIFFDVTPPGDSSANDGRIVVGLSGGTPPYQYEWNTGDSTGILSGVGVGSYALTVTDRNACTRSATTRVVLTSIEAPRLLRSVSLYPNPASTWLQADIQARQPLELLLQVRNLQGQLLHRQQLFGQRLTPKIDMRSFPSGMYVIQFGNPSGQLLYSARVVRE